MIRLVGWKPKGQFGTRISNIEGEFNSNYGLTADLYRWKAFLAKIHERISEDQEKIKVELSKEEPENAVKLMLYPDYDNALNQFEDMILKAVTVQLYSFFEDILKQLSIICEQEEKTWIKNYKKNLQSCLKSFEKNLGKKFTCGNEITNWTILRNLIVHHSSCCIKETHIKRVSKIQYLKLDFSFLYQPPKFIISDVNYVQSLLQIVERVLSEIVKEVKEKYDLMEYFDSHHKPK